MIDLQEETRFALIAAGFTDAQIDAETAACGGNFDKAADKLLASHTTTSPASRSSVSWKPTNTPCFAAGASAFCVWLDTRTGCTSELQPNPIVYIISQLL